MIPALARLLLLALALVAGAPDTVLSKTVLSMDAVATDGSPPAASATDTVPPAADSVPPAADAPPEATASSEGSEAGSPLVDSRSWSPVVATVLGFPSGYGDEEEDREGASWLLARALELEGNGRLEEHAAEMRVTVRRDRTLVTMIAPRESWRDAAGAVEALLFRLSVPAEAVEEARAAVLERLVFEEGAPVRSFEVEKWRTLAGPAHPWARPPEGSSTSVLARTVGELEAQRAEVFRRSGMTVAVVGSVTTEDLPAWLAEANGTVASGSSSSDPALAWSQPERRVVDRDVTSTWIAAAFPAPRDSSRTLLAFLAHVLHERFTPSPPDPGLLTSDVRVEELPGGPVILVRLAVDPRRTDRWEQRILETVSSLAETREQEAFFNFRRRRFRSELLHALANPEEEAERLVLDLKRRGTPRDIDEEIWSLTPARIQEAAASLGPPRILLYGPARMFEGR